MPDSALPPEDSRALWHMLQLQLAAGEAARDANIVGMRPRERWEPYRPAEAAKQLSPRAVGVLRRGVDNAVPEVLQCVPPARELDPMLLTGSVTAASFWVSRPPARVFTDEQALQALESFSDLVNGFLRSIPARRMPDEKPTAQNDRLLAYQRRRFGYESKTRPPRTLIARLPETADEFITSWMQLLLNDSRHAAHTSAAQLAVALGRPVDETIVHQLEIALATATVWRDLDALPNAPSSHPLLGDRPVIAHDQWDSAAGVINSSLRALEHPTSVMSDPSFVDKASLTPVAGVQLDGKSLHALNRLDDHVSLFAAWLRVGGGMDWEMEDRLQAFEESLGSGHTGNGHELVASLPPHALAVVGAFASEVQQDGNGHDIAGELAIALGDESLIGRYWRTLDTAAAWLEEEYSVLEQVGAAAEDDVEEELDDYSFFAQASFRESNDLLDFGAAVVELVRFGQSLGGGDIPEGWWYRFHTNQLSVMQGPEQRLRRLQPGSYSLLSRYRYRLGSPHPDESQDFVHALAQNLSHEVEHFGNLTLMVGLATGAAWLERFERDEVDADDSIFGIAPAFITPMVYTRARSQLRHSLTALLHVDSIRGI